MALATLSKYTPPRARASSALQRPPGSGSQYLPKDAPDPNPYKAWTPEGYGPDAFGRAPAQLHRPVNQTAEESARSDAFGQQVSSRWNQMTNDPRYLQAGEAYKAALGGGDPAALSQARAMFARVQDQIRRDNQWGSFNANPDAGWPVPAAPSGNYQYGPGRPGPTPPGVPQGMGGAGGMQGYQGGGPVQAWTLDFQPQRDLSPEQFQKYQQDQAIREQFQQLQQSDMGAATAFWNQHRDVFQPPGMAGRGGYSNYGGGGNAMTQGPMSLGPTQGSMPRAVADQFFGGGRGFPGGAQPAMSADVQRKLAMGMPPHLLGLPASGGGGRDFPGGVNPVNPGGPVQRPPIGGPPPMGPAPTPGAPRPNLPPMFQQPPFTGNIPGGMDLGMQAFGYRPMSYGGGGGMNPALLQMLMGGGGGMSQMGGMGYTPYAGMNRQTMPGPWQNVIGL